MFHEIRTDTQQRRAMPTPLNGSGAASKPFDKQSIVAAGPLTDIATDRGLRMPTCGCRSVDRRMEFRGASNAAGVRPRPGETLVKHLERHRTIAAPI